MIGGEWPLDGPNTGDVCLEDDSNVGMLAPVEMLIVDAFTRLIFGCTGDFGDEERRVTEALQLVEQGVSGNSIEEMGEFLGGLSVEEMIELVTRVHKAL
ncbi:MAG: hypothetical protein ACK5ME_08670 [Parahaliea sp.]